MDKWICKHMGKGMHTIINNRRYDFKTFESFILNKKNSKWSGRNGQIQVNISSPTENHRSQVEGKMLQNVGNGAHCEHAVLASHDRSSTVARLSSCPLCVLCAMAIMVRSMSLWHLKSALKPYFSSPSASVLCKAGNRLRITTIHRRMHIRVYLWVCMRVCMCL